MMFCNQIWYENQDIVQQIITMDFIQEMYTGTLSDQQFYYYIEQDILYLNNYAKACAYLVTKSETTEQTKFFLELVQSTFSEQERIHQVYSSNPDFQAIQKETPACQNYSNFILINSMSRPLAIAYASVVACPWLYVYIGELFSQKSFIDNKYQYWFQANYVTEVQKLLVIQKTMLEQLANQFPQYQSEMKKVFRQALFYEYSFWQDAYLMK